MIHFYKKKYFQTIRVKVEESLSVGEISVTANGEILDQNGYSDGQLNYFKNLKHNEQLDIETKSPLLFINPSR